METAQVLHGKLQGRWTSRTARMVLGILIAAVAVIAVVAWRLSASSAPAGGVVQAPHVATSLPPVTCYLHVGCGAAG
ncbi:MAG TPA: hypothetical protein VFW71_09770 [Actinomycetota bacterium]|nr:hypothetical protein [Actinomycetota bacterium]